jgi:hypothetical protein
MSRKQSFDFCRISDDNWEIYHTLTERTVTVGGKPRAGLKLDEAAIYVVAEQWRSDAGRGDFAVMLS